MFNWEENEKRKGRITWWFLEGYSDYINHHPCMREGYARYRMYSNLPIYVDADKSITGNLNWGIYKEIYWNNVGNQILCEELLEQFLNASEVSETEKEEVKNRLEIVKEHCLNGLDDKLPEELRNMSKSSAGTSTYYNGHMVLDYEQILRIGLGGYRERIEDYMKKAKDKESWYFYRGLLYALEGIQVYIQKHARMAEAAMQRGEDGNLREIKRVCDKVAWEAPDTLLEALQLVWFVFGFGDYDSYGRFDQYLYPFYEKEKKQSGEEKIKEMLAAFLEKGEENKGILNMTVGGKKEDGSNAVNDLTYLVMDVVRELGYKSPNLCLRISASSEDSLYRKAHENLATGQTIPALYNDDVIIPMLLQMGYPKEDAYTYCLAGCSQVIFPGKSNMCCDVGMYNALKTLELTLHNGMDIIQGKQAGIVQEDIETIDSFEEFYQRYLEQMRYVIECGVKINEIDILARKNMPSSVRTLFTKGCLESGKAIFQGGAQYNAVQNEIIGLTNTADAMLVIQKLVFEQKEFTLKELVNMLDADYEGYEAVRKHIIEDVPKFGNNQEEADEMRIRVGNDFYKELGSKPGTLGGKQWPGEVIFQSHINLAPLTAASADGRKANEPLADSAGAMRGCDVEGPTALIASFCKIPVTAPTVSRNLNIRFPKDIFQKEPNKITDLFRTFMQLGGVQMQINVLDKEELRKAQLSPEEYKNLVVRIGGYNDYFIDIPKHMQEEVIARTEQQI